MNPLKTLTLQLIPDAVFPMFQRMQFHEVEVPIDDVVMRGVYPWSGDSAGYDKHPSLVDKFLFELNQSGVKLPELAEHGWCHDVYSSHDAYSYINKRPRFTRLLLELQQRMYFVKKMSYRELLEIARNHLAENWKPGLVLTLLDRMYPRFNELRRYIKQKHPKVKLASYGDLHNIALHQLFNIEDFIDREQLLLSEAFPCSNFRSSAFLENVTDKQGRLQLGNHHQHFTVSAMSPIDRVLLTWSVSAEKASGMCRLIPQLGGSYLRRDFAMDFAKEWKIGDGNLCFSTSMDNVVQMMQSQQVEADFPTINYFQEVQPIRATADLQSIHSEIPQEVSSYRIRDIPTISWTGNELKNLLRSYDISTSGNKSDLLKRLAMYTAEEYQTQKSELDNYFTKHRFIHIREQPRRCDEFGVWEQKDALQNHLLVMYVMRHLRGDTILDPTHENTSTNSKQLALALVSKKVQLEGAFIPVI